FYVVLFDAEQDSIRFPYYVDSVDTNFPPPDKAVPMDTWHHSRTWYLLRENRTLMGNRHSIAEELDGPLHPVGPSAANWLGVPMRHGDTVIGA
ncbi:hypothetical protein, partial [Escherichia coli]|uniref:hypothetical protein n=1 Tax=Escherichia coli TaxID=562 RepID=UPI0013CF5F1E